MSRSFVRAWATVATIMAMVCLAFVQPMPEHVSTSSDATVKTETKSLQTAADRSIGQTAPFVDSITTGKTFTPYVTLPGWQLLQDAPSRRLTVFAAADAPRSPPNDPPTRPG
jgi:hypothetical protein